MNNPDGTTTLYLLDPNNPNWKIKITRMSLTSTKYGKLDVKDLEYPIQGKKYVIAPFNIKISITHDTESKHPGFHVEEWCCS